MGAVRLLLVIATATTAGRLARSRVAPLGQLASRCSTRARDTGFDTYLAFKEGKYSLEEYKKLGMELAQAKVDKQAGNAKRFRDKFGKQMAEKMGLPLDRIIIEKVSAEDPNQDIETLLNGNGKGIKVDFAVKQNPGDPTASTMLMAATGGPSGDIKIGDMLRLNLVQEKSFAEVYEKMKETGQIAPNTLDFDGLTRVLGNIEPPLDEDQRAILVNMGLQIAAMQPEPPFFDNDDSRLVPSDPVEDALANIISNAS
uniref:Uncharacterized protein n=1 Tax=Lotharella globosa TaxID=91324 RepID=A0A7S3YG61_9EUKA|mmetsp:Transcript_23081/g.46298  ORF Transcript_23081/g.46298 Transcript_23081/m.46298 type:complete len:256 (+) Transcript_23081:27-794(+)